MPFKSYEIDSIRNAVQSLESAVNQAQGSGPGKSAGPAKSSLDAILAKVGGSLESAAGRLEYDSGALQRNATRYSRAESASEIQDATGNLSGAAAGSRKEAEESRDLAGRIRRVLGLALRVSRDLESRLQEEVAGTQRQQDAAYGTPGYGAGTAAQYVYASQSGYSAAAVQSPHYSACLDGVLARSSEEPYSVPSADLFYASCAPVGYPNFCGGVYSVSIRTKTAHEYQLRTGGFVEPWI